MMANEVGDVGFVFEDENRWFHWMAALVVSQGFYIEPGFPARNMGVE